MNYDTLLIWLLHIPLQLPCGIISTNPCTDCACTVAIAITAGLMVDCCLSKMLFFNCCSSRISYCHAKTVGLSYKKHSLWSSVTFLPSTAMLPLGWQSNAIVATFPLCSLDNLTFISAAAEARWLLLPYIISVWDLFLWKRLPQCCHSVTLPRRQLKAIPSALPSAMMLLPSDNTAAVADTCWLLIVIFGCCRDISSSKKAAITLPLCCDAVKVVAKSDTLSAANCSDAATFQHAVADAC